MRLSSLGRHRARLVVALVVTLAAAVISLVAPAAGTEDVGARSGQEPTVRARSTEIRSHANSTGALERYNATNRRIAAERFPGRRCAWHELDTGSVAAILVAGRSYRRVCSGAGAAPTSAIVQHTPPVDDVSLIMATVERERSSLDLSLPVPVSDPAVRGLVGVPTSFGFGELLAPRTRTASAGGVTATITATPRTVVVDPGDGSIPRQCSVAQFASASATTSPCMHTYDAPSPNAEPFPVAISVTWRVRWDADSGAGAPLAASTTTSPTLDFVVIEAQAVITD
jgi:hypothetical protein